MDSYSFIILGGKTSTLIFPIFTDIEALGYENEPIVKNLKKNKYEKL